MSEILKANSWELDNQADLGYGQLLAVFWRRRWWFFGVFGAVVALSIPVTLSKTPTYQSSMQLLVEPNYKNKQTNRSSEELNLTDPNFELDYATQQNIMASSGILQKAAQRVREQFPGWTVKEIVEHLQENLIVYQVRNEVDNNLIDTKIFQIEYYGYDSVQTQKVLEEIERVYQEYNLEQQEKRLEEGLSFIDQQLPEARKDLLQAEESLKEFRLQYNFISPDEDFKLASENLKEIQRERESLQADLNENKGRSNEIQQKLNIPGQQALIASRLSESTRYQNILDKIQETELELKKQRTKFNDSHPIIQNLLEQRENQQQLLKEEIKNVLGIIPPGLDVTVTALQKEGQLGSTGLNFTNSLAEALTNIKSLQERDRALAETEAKLKQQVDIYPNIIDRYNSLEQEVEIKRTTLQRLLEAKQELGIEINRGGVNWQTIEAPQEGEQIAPNTLKDLLLGGVVGLFLGGIAAFVREALDDKIYSCAQLQEQTSLPLLGNVPKLSVINSQKFLGELPSNPAGSILEIIQSLPVINAFDLIYENLQLVNSDSTIKSVAVTSANATEGRSTVALGLALSAARRHKKVLVIDANLRDSNLDKEFSLPNQRGLTNLLGDRIDLPYLHKFSILGSSISLLTSGPTTPDPIGLLSSSRLKKVIQHLEQKYDLIVVDTPPILGTVDAIQTASCCNASVMVVRLEKTSSSALTEANALLSRLKVLGVIANDLAEKTFSQTTFYLPPTKSTPLLGE